MSPVVLMYIGTKANHITHVVYLQVIRIIKFIFHDGSDHDDSNAIMDDLCLHAEPNELGFVEGLRDLPCQDSVHRADHHQEDWVAEGNHTNIYLHTLPYYTFINYLKVIM